MDKRKQGFFKRFLVIFNLVVVCLFFANIVCADSDVGFGFFSTEGIAQYISSVYTYAIGAALALAVIALVIGGFNYLTSYGSSEKITHAKELIFAAISGLIIILISYLLLNTMDPRLVNLKNPKPVELDVDEKLCSELSIKGYHCVPKGTCEGSTRAAKCGEEEDCCKTVGDDVACVYECTDKNKCEDSYGHKSASCQATTSECNLLLGPSPEEFGWHRTKRQQCGEGTCKRSSTDAWCE